MLAAALGLLSLGLASAADIGNDERVGVGGWVAAGVGTGYGTQVESGLSFRAYTRRDAAFQLEVGGWSSLGQPGVATRVRGRFDRLTYQFNRCESSCGYFYSGSGVTALMSNPTDPWVRIGLSQTGGMLWQLRNTPVEIAGEVGFDLYVYDQRVGITFGSDITITGGVQVRYFF